MRLTNVLKESITVELLKKSGLREKAEKKYKELVDGVIKEYTNRWSKDLEAMNKLPEGYFSSTNRAYYSYRNNNTGVTMPSIIIPDKYLQWNEKNVKLEDNKKLLKIYKEWQSLKESQREVRNEARSILASVTTVKRLIEAWPEVEPMIPKASKPTALMPLKSIENLNKLVPLP